MKKTTHRSRVLILVLILIVGIGLVGFFVKKTSTSEIPKGYVKVNSYDPDALCLANGPSCGQCIEGVIIDKQCYVPKDSSFAED